MLIFGALQIGLLHSFSPVVLNRIEWSEDRLEHLRYLSTVG